MLIKIKSKLNSQQQNNQPQVKSWNLFNSLLISHIHFYLFIEILNARIVPDSGFFSIFWKGQTIKVKKLVNSFLRFWKDWSRMWLKAFYMRINNSAWPYLARFLFGKCIHPLYNACIYIYLLSGMARIAWFEKIFIMYKSETRSICTQTAMPSISFSGKQFKKLQSHFILFISME